MDLTLFREKVSEVFSDLYVYFEGLRQNHSGVFYIIGGGNCLEVVVNDFISVQQDMSKTRVYSTEQPKSDSLSGVELLVLELSRRPTFLGIVPFSKDVIEVLEQRGFNVVNGGKSPETFYKFYSRPNEDSSES